MMERCKLFTPRLLLRPFERRDIPALFELLRDEEVNVFLPWFPAKTMEDAERFYGARLANPEGRAFAICPKEQDMPVGYVWTAGERPWDLGYGLKRECWGRGIVSEAASAVIERARQDGLPYLTATHDVNNPRSGGVMRRVGMRYCYSYREQWQPKDISVVFRMYQIDLNGEHAPDPVYWNRYEEHFIEQNL